MKFARLRTAQGPRPVVVSEDEAYDLAGFLGDITPKTVGLLDEAAAAAAGGRLDAVDLAGAVFEAPIDRAGAVIAIGMNYAAHAAESGSAPPAAPVMFLKTPNTVAAPDDPFEIPPGAVKVDWEVELAMVIKRRAYRLAADDDPLSYVAGFTVADDLSERTYQLEESGGQWSKGKCLPGSTPLGPWLVSPDEVEPSALRLRSFVDDDPRQDSSTADMIFDCATIVRHLSRYLALEPGDVVLTGTPEGVALSGRFPYLKPGDVVRIEIDGLGGQTHRMVGAGPA
ncbi:fumarylacetoacetate hydrolase family protein [Microlunatus ginsengisoli]|uniref:Fumarylacetoacetate hydrolase family protein n=1 Tax=Microlunatus ginsengisoli TaxID=363863 RepID=A0ABP7AIW9_9ACTN